MTDAALTLDAVGEVLRSADLLTETRGSGDVVVMGVTQDSREVEAGNLFLAWKGTEFDAHDFVAGAAERGAVATIVERPLDVGIAQLVVSNGRKAAALAADAVMGFPSREILTLGVTGTNGKTTTALLIRHLLALDLKTVVIGTLGVLDEEGVRPGTEGLTTPGPVQVAVWLRQLVDGGAGAVVLEASSHALEQHRLDGVRFDVGIFTNLTQDHLDYHGDLQAYRRAKVRLVGLVADDGTVIVNGADPAWTALDVGSRELKTFAVGAEADLSATDVVLGPDRTAFTLLAGGSAYSVRTPLIGAYNVENTLGAIAAARAAGLSMARIVERLASAPQASGRLEAVITEPFSVLIDFAHTPAALQGALSAVGPLTKGRLIVLFGAGGDRDRSKRLAMAEAVSAMADIVVLTSDNPRTEDPEVILDDLAEGLGGIDYVRLVDRRQAIVRTLEIAEPGDTVVLAGKGHETYQVVGTEKRSFDERVIVREALEAMGVS
jgi:UDP-N-acetylmuramoyl-L-alanyl-D-glutamate--2,6-diaminopimelate ligase